MPCKQVRAVAMLTGVGGARVAGGPIPMQCPESR
jgi:hypothetical protein